MFIKHLSSDIGILLCLERRKYKILLDRLFLMLPNLDIQAKVDLYSGQMILARGSR